MATYTVTIPIKSGTVKVGCDGISLCDFHLLSKSIDDFITKRVSQSSAPALMRPLGAEERTAIAMTSWHTPPIGELEAPCKKKASVAKEADAWKEASGYNKLVEQRKMLDAQILALGETAEGKKYLGSKASSKVVKSRKTGEMKDASVLKAEKKARAEARKAKRDKGECVKCGIGGCQKTFMKENSFFVKCQAKCSAKLEGK